MFNTKIKVALVALIAIVAIAIPVINAQKSSGCGQIKEGVLTIGTDDPAYGPWFDDNDPANGKGYEAAVAYAVAEELGYSKDKVEWVKVPFNKVIQPGCKTFDFDINQVSITDERKNAVDFSSPYYTAPQAIVSFKGSKIDGKTTLAELKSAKLGAAVGTTSLDAIENQIGAKPQVFNDNAAGVSALKNKQIDGLVVDLPTAFYLSGVEVPNGLIVGQLPSTGSGDQFGLLLTKGSALTSCVSGAVDAITADGTLAAITDKWLATDAGAPVLKP